jgi:hypothetical protein
MLLTAQEKWRLAAVLTRKAREASTDERAELLRYARYLVSPAIS